AVIVFGDMNPNLSLIKDSEIPEFCQVIPSRWLFEGLSVAQVKLNPYDATIRELTEQRDQTSNYQEKSKLLYQLSKYTQAHDINLFRNEELNDWVDRQDAKRMNRGGNYFMTSKVKLGGKEIWTFYFNAIVILFMCMVYNAIVYIKLVRFYR
ncbi:MAG: hypothetical protein K8S56_01475, partial [Candidatus Cloacimonetes bacterium]|nr:hypothetical protein [Candidatus Cloacimonadota bacterium]